LQEQPPAGKHDGDTADGAGRHCADVSSSCFALIAWLPWTTILIASANTHRLTAALMRRPQRCSVLNSAAEQCSSVPMSQCLRGRPVWMHPPCTG
jgi:hypothetical protein